MSNVHPFWKAPNSLRDWWLDVEGERFGLHDPSSEDDHWVAVEEVRKTWNKRRFEIEKPVFVTVQETLTHDSEGPMICTVIPFGDFHLLAVNRWALERIEGRDRHDVLAHELCHVQIAEEYGEHSEQHREFGRLVSQKRAAASTGDVTSEGFWDSYSV